MSHETDRAPVLIDRLGILALVAGLLLGLARCVRRGGSLAAPAETAAAIFPCPASATSVAWSPDGSLLAAAVSGPGGVGEDGEIHVPMTGQLEVRDAATGALRWVLKRHAGMVGALAFLPDGETLVSGSRVETRLWNARAGTLLRAWRPEPPVERFHGFTPDGKTCFTERGQQIESWDIATGQRKQHGALPIVAQYPVGISSRGHCLLLASDHALFVAPEAATRPRKTEAGEQELLIQPLRKLADSLPGICTIALSPDGRQAATGHWNGSLRLWDPASGRQLVELPPHASGVSTLAWSPDGRWLASTEQGFEPASEVRLWDARSGRLARRFVGHGAPVAALAFSPDGRRLASASIDHTVRLWNVPE